MGDFMPIIAKNHTSLLKKNWLEKKVIYNEIFRLSFMKKYISKKP